MRARSLLSLPLLVILMMQSIVPLSDAFAQESDSSILFVEKKFTKPIDALSIRLPESQEAVLYQYEHKGRWSTWQEYDNDGDAISGEESELFMIPKGVTGVRIHPSIAEKDIHEIIVSHEPLQYNIVSTKNVERRIMTRAEWGADESVALRSPMPSSDSDGNATKGDNGSLQTNEKREQDCMNLRNAFSGEFTIDHTVSKDKKGRSYSWPLQYSKDVRLLVVHHTALGVTNDPRSGVERMRALYKYHAINKGWGDIGYHYAIDEKGMIYEGRAGGSKVIGGHAYCNNIGTIGVVLMGNFELEKPSQAQAKSLQWLLADLSKEYNINLAKPVTFHGKTFKSPIVGHRDLLSTACPGATLFAGLAQIRSNTVDGRLDSAVDFPEPPHSLSSSKNTSGGTLQNTLDQNGMQEGIGFTGRTQIGMNPGGKQRISFTYTTGQDGVYQGKKIADISLSHPEVKLWIDDGQYLLPVRTAILSPSDIPAGETLSFQLILEAPMTAGTYPLRIGGIDLTLIVEGRRARTGTFTNPFYAKPALIVKPQSSSSSPSLLQKKIARQTQKQSSKKTRSESLSSSATTKKTSSSLSSLVPKTYHLEPNNIRIALSIDAEPIIAFQDDGFVGDMAIHGGRAFSLIGRKDECVVLSQGQEFAHDRIIRFKSNTSVPLTVQGVKGMNRLYQGNLECRIVDGALTLINELPLEEYMAGLAEEPDTEPYEKQRAFAIAARTYATYYMDPKNRKFPGKPFDGSDDPAKFQVYKGVDFAMQNPQWKKAVESTKKQVLTYKNALIRPPYFSSDDGRTRSPSEAGWNNFPNAEILESKPDPWCTGMTLRGHGVGMSGCGAKGQAKEGRSAEQILQYYYPGVRIIEQ